MKKHPRVETSDALKSLYSWWHHVLDSGSFLNNPSNLIRVDGDLVYLLFQDVKHFQGFQPVSEHDSSPGKYLVYTVSHAEHLADIVRDAVKYVLSGDDNILHTSEEIKRLRGRGLLTPLTKEERKSYSYIFQEPTTSLVRLSHDNTDYPCVCTSSTLIHPYGEKSSLSENVFKYGRRVLLAPAHQVILHQGK